YTTFLSFIAPSTPVIFTLSLHDALPIFYKIFRFFKLFRIHIILPVLPFLSSQHKMNAENLFKEIHLLFQKAQFQRNISVGINDQDRKSTRLNSSHVSISYAVFCLKK